VLNEGAGSWTARRARKTPDARAILHAGRALTYAGLHDRVTRLARALRGLGTGPGSRVAYLGPNHPAFLETMFATWSAGAVFVPLNMRLAGPELADQLGDCGAALLVYAPEQAAVVARIRGQARPGHLVAVAGPAPGGGGGARPRGITTTRACWPARPRSRPTCRSAWMTPA
jgi:fatty-acyl-CoA synthase